MRRVLGLVLGSLVVAAGLAPGTAVAKGPVSATIEGGDRVVSVEWKANGGRGTLADLIDVTSFWNVARARPTAEPARKGPAYVVRYLLGATPAGDPIEFRQVLYPESSAGSVVHTPGGQQRYGAIVPANWAEAPVNLSLFLRSYGLTGPAATPAATPAPAAAENDWRGWRGWWPAAGLLVLVVLGVTGFRVVRRAPAGTPG